MHRRSGAHDRSRNLVRHAFWDPRCVLRRRGDVLLVCARRYQASAYALRAIVLPSIPALFTIMADIPERLDPTSVTNLPVCNVLADFYNLTSTFVTSAFAAECGHWWDGPVVHHEVDVGHAETGGIELEQDLVVLCG